MTTQTGSGQNYYVDSVNGSDSNSGTSADQAWRSLTPVNNRHFAPGDTINFASGSSWTGDVWPGGLEITDSGVEGNPITYRSYGDGPKPIFRNLNAEWGVGIESEGSWIVIDGLAAIDCGRYGIYLGGDHSIVRNVEVTQSGVGVGMFGQYGLVTKSYFHDLKMVVNTPGGDDDNGAVGVVLFNSNNEVSYNRFVRCIAPSYDYITDGGAVEWWGNVDNSYVHHNWAEGNEGFLEVGGGTVRNTLVAYNVSLNNNGNFSTLQLNGTFVATISGFKVVNNTIIDTGTYAQTKWNVFSFSIEPSADTFLARNNIVYIKDIEAISDRSKFTHDHNIYYLLKANSSVGFPLGAGETVADPLFASLDAGDFHLRPGSPAIDKGADWGQQTDFDSLAVPVGSSVDIGAYEYRLALAMPVTQGAEMTTVSVPVNASNVSGVSSADVVVSFDDQVLRAVGVEAGSLNPDWNVTTDTSNPGELHISMAGGASLTEDSGTLATLKFEVIGSTGMTSVLHVVKGTLNDGAAPAETRDGLFTIGSVTVGEHSVLLPLIVNVGN